MYGYEKRTGTRWATHGLSEEASHVAGMYSKQPWPRAKPHGGCTSQAYEGSPLHPLIHGPSPRNQSTHDTQGQVGTGMYGDCKKAGSRVKIREVYERGTRSKHAWAKPYKMLPCSPREVRLAYQLLQFVLHLHSSQLCDEPFKYLGPWRDLKVCTYQECYLTCWVPKPPGPQIVRREGATEDQK